MATLTAEEILSQLSDEERATVEQAMVAKKNKPIRFKVSEKGGVSVYGLNVRFPVTLYANQWQRFADEDLIPKILAFIDDNKADLSVK
jgi:hypothetical protein